MKDGRGEEAVYRLTEAGKVALLAIQTQPEQVIGAVEAVEQIGEEA
jgi:DNA-binding PadR family transcriptional regulator